MRNMRMAVLVLAAGTSKSDGSSTPGFVAVVAIIGLLLAYLRKRA